MRGDDQQQAAMYSYISPEQRVPADHPLRPIRSMVDDVLRGLSRDFDRLYARTGRPSIPPEKLLRALLLQLLYSVRSERQLMEQLDYNLLFRWFVGLNMDDAVWDPTVFTKNRDRLLAGDIAQGFFDQVLAQAYARELVSLEHFSVDGTLLKAWASQKSVQPKTPDDRPPTAAGRRWAQSERELPGAGPHERHACLDDGAGGTAVQEGAGTARRAQLAGLSPPRAWPRPSCAPSPRRPRSSGRAEPMAGERDTRAMSIAQN